ncbi:MAG: isocitrate lyase/phosphoenolpyruvate mutase family protein [Cohnella sp.]|nr:isocitrate lyase/phosphoenolpyruvate mutase family protein [Cohnella sp.]
MNLIERFQSLHESDELLLLGNAWDLPSAKALEQAGFKAIGTTSWGIAASRGFADGEALDFDIQLGTIKRIVDHVGVPVTADIESGYGQDDASIVDNVLKAADLGVAGINLEDSLKSEAGMKPIPDQSRLLFNIREALVKRGFGLLYLNARTDTYLLPHRDSLGETLNRARAYAENGASGIFVPGLTNADEIRVVASSVRAPLNVMALPGLTDCEELRKLGVRRLSLGGSLYRKTFKLLEQNAAEMMNSRNVSVLFE